MTTRLTAGQIAGYAYAAGFRGTALRNAVAVALAESGGNPAAVGTNSDQWRSRDRGLWQINSHWHPEVSDAAAFNPATAAVAAYRISSHGTSWSAWSTWKNGAAQTQMGVATIGVTQAQNADFKLPGPIPDIPLPGPDFGPFVGPETLLKGLKTEIDIWKAGIGMAVKAGVWLSDSHNWLRVAMVAGGSVGVLLALEMIGKSGAAGEAGSTVAAIPGKALHAAASKAIDTGKTAAMAAAAA